MKKKGVFISPHAMRAVIALMLCPVIGFSFTGCAKDKIPESGDIDNPKVTHTGVQVIEVKSDEEESSYQVGASISATDFAAVGEKIKEIIAQDWNTYESMTEMERVVSSHMWGVVNYETNHWSELEEELGFTVDNPLEKLDWLKKNSCYRKNGDFSLSPTEHINLEVYSLEDARKIHRMFADAEYYTEKAEITLTTVLSANAGTYTTRSIDNEYTTYKHNPATTKSGIPVVIVSRNESNNLSYATHAYWVKENVFYSLNVRGKEIDKVEIQAVLDRILADI